VFNFVSNEMLEEESVDFVIYSPTRIRLDLLEHDDSIQWYEEYQAPGEVKVVAQLTEKNLALLIEGNRIYNPDTDTVARIDHVDLDQLKNEDVITARAKLTAELLEERVVMATVNVTNVEAAMYGIYAQNRRGMPIEIGASRGFAERNDMEITWNSVLDAEKRLADVSGLGFKVIFEPETGLETLVVYKGVDRTNENNDDYIGYFGTDVEAIENVSVSKGITEYKNVAVVAGAGEGADRTVRIVSLGNFTGEYRRELYVDARDLQREYQVATPTGTFDQQGNPIYSYETRTYPEHQYLAMLDQRGREKLAERLRTFSITCDITQNNVVYGVDYNLGDRVPVKLPEYGIYATARVAAATRIYEMGGRKIVAIFSEFELEGSS
jgi:hypothetical protein